MKASEQGHHGTPHSLRKGPEDRQGSEGGDVYCRKKR